jgi:hypothetical protein
MLFQKRVVGTKFDVYVFFISISAPSNYKTDEGIDLIWKQNSQNSANVTYTRGRKTLVLVINTWFMNYQFRLNKYI